MPTLPLLIARPRLTWFCIKILWYSSIVPLNEVWSTKRKKEINHKDEVTRPVPNGWTEDDSTCWKPRKKRTYTGPEGGGHIGPSHLVKAAIGQSNDIKPIVNLFLFLWTEDQLQTIAKMSEKYARGDWVKVSARHDAAGNERQRPILVHCAPNDPDRRHRHPDENSWKEITVGYILAFLSILMLRGACDKLLEMAGLLLNGVGRVLYTENFYTGIKLMENCYFRHGFLMVGTHVLPP